MILLADIVLYYRSSISGIRTQSFNTL